MRALRFLAALMGALLGHLLLVALVPSAVRLVDLFLLAVTYLAMTSRPAGAAATGAVFGLVHDGLSGGLYGLQGFASTVVGLAMARVAGLIDLQKSYYIALYFASAVLLQQLVLEGLMLLLTQRPEPVSLLDLGLRVGLAGPLGALLVAGVERAVGSVRLWRARRRAEIFLD